MARACPRLLIALLYAVFCAGAPAVGSREPPTRTVLVTGATGRTGSLIYQQLRATRGVSVRAFVLSRADARGTLGCTACDASEGIFVGDVTDASSLLAPMAGVDSVACAVGVAAVSNDTLVKDVEWLGVENQVAALAQANPAEAGAGTLYFALISSMDTTLDPQPVWSGKALFYKLQAEAFLQSAGVGFSIVKPCSLNDAPPGASDLQVGHDDRLMGGKAVARADVAAVVATAVMLRATGLRFDLCAADGAPTTDLPALLKRARWPWQQLQASPP